MLRVLLHLLSPVTAMSTPVPAVPTARARGSEDVVRVILSQVLTLNNAKTCIFYLVVWHHLVRVLRHLKVYGVTASVHQLYVALYRSAVLLFMRLPAIRRRVNKELDDVEADLERKLVARPAYLENYNELPFQGLDVATLRTELHKLQLLELGSSEDGVDPEAEAGPDAWKDVDGQRVWQTGKISGAVYHGGKEFNDLLADAIKMFMVSNPLHPEVFPGIRRMEAEIVSMVLQMYNAPDGAAGATTSGGTESILMACKAHRDWGRAVKGITEPEIVIPETAHAAFNKAGAYFGMTVRSIKVNPVTRQVDMRAVRRAITANTVLIVGSAPNFPDGAIDPISELGKLASKSRVGLHVDCCLGSFIVPFLEEAGFIDAPRFDFRVPGVTSISCDTHKYGFAPKGSSVVMFRTSELRRFMYYVQPNWTGGVYASPAMAGSRPGALIAGTWAAMMKMGRQGYVQSCLEIVTSARKISAAISNEIPQLKVMGNPKASVVAFASAGRINIYDVGDEMSKRGWHLNALATNPPAIHLAVTRLSVPATDGFISDLKAAVKTARNAPAKPGTMATLYGLGQQSAVGPALVSQLAARFIDTLYKT